MKNSELDRLIKAITDGDISAVDLAAFETEMTTNSVSMRYYLDMVDMDNLLHHQCNLNDYILKPVVSMDLVLQQQKKKTWKMVALSTAALFICGLIVLTLFNTDQEDQLTLRLGPDTRYSLTHSDSDQQPNDLTMRKGSRLKIDYGTVELNFESGVRAVVKAPADIEMLESDQLKMRSGIAWYHVPSGEEGFTVHTNELTVVDLGTEFGIKASLKELDEVHVITGKVTVTSLRARKGSTELSANNARRIDSIGRLENIPLQANLFIDKLPAKSNVRIVLEDQFNNGLENWSNPKGNATFIEGDYRDKGCIIDTNGEEDHSLIHFDHTGSEINSSGNGYIALGDKAKPGTNQISTTIKIHKGRTYTIHFRHAGSHNGTQKAVASVELNNKQLAHQSFDCPDKWWASASLSFTSQVDGIATLNISNIGSTVSDASDTLIDSVLITSSPDSN